MFTLHKKVVTLQEELLEANRVNTNLTAQIQGLQRRQMKDAVTQTGEGSEYKIDEYFERKSIASEMFLVSESTKRTF